MDLNSRDIAAIIAVGLLALVLWWRHALGGIVRSFLRIFESRVLIEISLLVAAWTTLLILVAERVGLWDPTLLRDTVLSVVPALSLVAGAGKAAQTEGWYRKKIGRAFLLTVLVEFVVGLTTFDLAIEVFLLIVGFFAAAFVALRGGRDKAHERVTRLSQRVLQVLGVILIGAPVLYLIQNAGTLDWAELLRKLGLSVWLTVFTLPLVFYLSLVLTYEEVLGFVMRRYDTIRWFHRPALVAAFNVRPRRLRRFGYGPQMDDFAKTTSFREALKVTRGPVVTWSDLIAEDVENEEAEVEARRRRKRNRPHGRRRSS